MEAIAINGKDGLGRAKVFAVADKKVQPGDYVLNADNELEQVNQATCIFFGRAVLGDVDPALNLADGEALTVVFRCNNVDHCQHPFCKGYCEGGAEMYSVDVHLGYHQITPPS